MAEMRTNLDPLSLFQMYMEVTGVPTLGHSEEGDAKLFGKSLGILNGSSWITLWSNYFGRKFLPEVKLVNVGNEATQLNFMKAHHHGEKCPPDKNIEVFARYAVDLVELWGVDAILISCSTMNRSYPAVQEAVAAYGVPVVPIDLPMMEKAVEVGSNIMVVATHGPTVDSTGLLLKETAAEKGKEISIVGATVEEAFDYLGAGKIKEHNEVIAAAIRQAADNNSIDAVVLAQLSMAVFKLSHPEPEKEFGFPIITSGEEGFKRMRKLLSE